jgi:hypothetical protein
MIADDSIFEGDLFVDFRLKGDNGIVVDDLIFEGVDKELNDTELNEIVDEKSIISSEDSLKDVEPFFAEEEIEKVVIPTNEILEIALKISKLPKGFAGMKMSSGANFLLRAYENRVQYSDNEIVMFELPLNLEFPDMMALARESEITFYIADNSYTSMTLLNRLSTLLDNGFKVSGTKTITKKNPKILDTSNSFQALEITVK